MSVELSQLWAALTGWMADSKILVIIGLILLDLVVGVAASLKRQDFQWRRLADFYVTGVIPKLIGYIALHIVIDAVAGLNSYIADGAQWAAFAVLMASLVGSVAGNFKDIYGQELPVVDHG